jgi:UPF0755 protein
MMKRILFLMFILCVVVAAMGIALAGRTILLSPGPLAATVDVVIPQGDGPRAIAARLQTAGVIRNANIFVGVVRIKGLSAKLKAGEYMFEPRTSLLQVIHKLVEGSTRNRTVTIPEGFTVRQAVERLKALPGLKGEFTIPAEGAIFPDTYQFEFGNARQKVIDAMEKRMTEELQLAWEKRDLGLPLKSAQEALILASIVQKEAANEEEMPKVAGVFVNRLNKGMRLQSDPTVMYGAELDGHLRKKDLTEPHPFNTYVYAGLPPTPIANPGKAALWAATHPETAGGLLYFVANPNGGAHTFSATYEEHQKHVKSYWESITKWRKAQKEESQKEEAQKAAATPSPSAPVAQGQGAPAVQVVSATAHKL